LYVRGESIEGKSIVAGGGVCTVALKKLRLFMSVYYQTLVRSDRNSRALTIFMSFQYYAHKSGQKIPVRYLVLHYTFARFQSTLCTGLFFLVRCDGRIAICADTATPIYRYIEFKGQFQVISSYEMAIMGVMLCLGFTNKSEICRAS
jgi:hypothetical protein